MSITDFMWLNIRIVDRDFDDRGFRDFGFREVVFKITDIDFARFAKDEDEDREMIKKL